MINTQKEKHQFEKQINSYQLNNIQKKIQQILANQLTQTKNYQKFLLILFSMSYFFLTYIKFIPYFIFMNPIFICHGIETNQQKACQILNQCIILNNFTGTFFNNLYCEKQKYRSIIQSSLAIGVLIGNFTIVPLSNMKGRKFTYILSYFLLIIGLILLYIGIYLNLWYLSSLALFINGISWAGINILMAIITSQFCDEQTSQKYLLVYYIMWGLAIMSYGLSYYYMPHWHQHFIYLLLLPTLILFFISTIFLIQTPQYWLFIAHDVNNFNKDVQKLTIYNGINENIKGQLNILVEQFINLEKQSQKNQNKRHSLNLFTSNRKIIINCICFTLLFLAIDFYYYSMQGTMQRTGYNFGVSMLIAGIHETVGFIIMVPLINKINKKVGLLAFTILATLCGLSFLLNKVKTDNFLQSIAISISSFSSVFIFALLAVMELQVFTTETRAIAMGIANGLGDIIVILQPYIVNFVNSFQFHPIIVCSCFYLALGILPIYFISNKNEVNQKKNQYGDQYFNQQQT